jgi:hypothetical protein
MYYEAMEKIPEQHWRSGEIDYLIPARLVYHVLETADFYSSVSPKEFPWGKRFGVDCFDSPPESLPSRDEAQKYHEEVRRKVREWILGLGNSGLLEEETEFPWTGSVVLGRVLYVLGHYRQHFGELNAELRRRGLPRVEWRTL